MGDGDGLRMWVRGPEESALRPRSSDLRPLSSIRSLDPERALTTTRPTLRSRERERRISPSPRELLRPERLGVNLLKTRARRTSDRGAVGRWDGGGKVFVSE